MSRKGDCRANAVKEKTLKTENVYFERYRSRGEARTKLSYYIKVFYNRHRVSSLDFGSPGEAVTEKKKGHIIQSAQDFLVRFGGMSVPEVCFDVVSLVLGKDAKAVALTPRS